MPYVITTTTQRATARTANGRELERHERSGTVDRSRHAVATLEEARDATTAIVNDALADLREVGGWEVYDVAARALPESGGTIGPLPDETVLEVAFEPWSRFEHPMVRSEDHAGMIDAYNARQLVER